MRVSKLLVAAAGLSALVGSTALAQEMGGAMGPGSDYGYAPQPYSGQGYPVRGFVPFESNADANARMVPSDSYCVTRHRSGEPRTGTFIGDDGRRHPC
jgi:BA14K-like protein